jgi:hypothetical protein
MFCKTFTETTRVRLGELRMKTVSSANSAALDNEFFLRERVLTPRRAAALVAAFVGR